jgi:hypothetical protein
MGAIIMKNIKKVLPFIAGLFGLTVVTSLVAYVDKSLTFNDLFWASLVLFIIIEMIWDKLRLGKVSQSVDDVVQNNLVDNTDLFKELERSHKRLDKLTEDFNRKNNYLEFLINNTRTLSELNKIGNKLENQKTRDQLSELEFGIKMDKVDKEFADKKAVQ